MSSAVLDICGANVGFPVLLSPGFNWVPILILVIGAATLIGGWLYRPRIATVADLECFLAILDEQSRLPKDPAPVAQQPPALVPAPQPESAERLKALLYDFNCKFASVVAVAWLLGCTPSARHLRLRSRLLHVRMRFLLRWHSMRIRLFLPRWLPTQVDIANLSCCSQDLLSRARQVYERLNAQDIEDIRAEVRRSRKATSAFRIP